MAGSYRWARSKCMASQCLDEPCRLGFGIVQLDYSSLPMDICPWCLSIFLRVVTPADPAIVIAGRGRHYAAIMGFRSHTSVSRTYQSVTEEAMGRVLRRSAGMVVVLVLLLPAAAAAQATITGVVKDTSGAVLPGATVEAASPVLIEKVRSVVTDATGQYRIVDLRPGTYSVTFTLTGFSVVKRDGIELTGNFVATVNADLKVGAVAETITVSGEAPVVDVQSTRNQQTLSKDVLAAVPTSRTNSNHCRCSFPGSSRFDRMSAASVQPDVAGRHRAHPRRALHRSAQPDGWHDDNHGNGGSGTGNLVNIAGAQEVVDHHVRGLGEAETSGVMVNVIPRDGANTFTGHVRRQRRERIDAVEQLHAGVERPRPDGAGAAAESATTSIRWAAGAIIRDRLWFYVTARVWGADQRSRACLPTRMPPTRMPGRTIPTSTRQTFNDGINRTLPIVRLTGQATPRNKLTFYWSDSTSCERCRGGAGVGGGSTATATTESNGIFEFTPSHVFQTTYSSPVSSRFLVEAGYGAYLATWGSGWRSDTGRSRGNRQQPQHRVGPGRRTGRQHPGPGVPVPGQFQPESDRDENLAGVGVVCPWRAQHEVRLLRRAFPAGEPNITFYLQDAYQYRFNNGVPNQLSEQGIVPETQHRCPGERLGDVPLRAGSVDPRQADTARGPSVRPHVDDISRR